MFRLPIIRVDLFSFLLGFASGFILWWIIGQIKKAVPVIKANAAARREAQRAKRNAGIVAFLSTGLRKRIQNCHVAAPLFPLDEILIEPRFLAPQPAPLETGEFHYDRLITRNLPYLPDAAEILTSMGWPLLNAEELIRSSARVALVGSPGSGKTVSLHYIAKLALQDEETKKYPLLVHILDIDPAQTDPYTALAQAHQNTSDPRQIKEIRSFLKEKLERDEILLLVDGFDQISEPLLSDKFAFVRDLLEKYPGLPAIIAANSDQLDGFMDAGFELIGMAAWTRTDRSAFINRWWQAWQNNIFTRMKLSNNDSHFARPEIVLSWLQQDQQISTPLEQTLKIWAALAGDLSGLKAENAVKAYVERMLETDHPDEAICKTSLESIKADTPYLSTASLLDISTKLLENSGMVFTNIHGNAYFKHLTFCGYLAAQCQQPLDKEFSTIGSLSPADQIYLKFKGYSGDISEPVQQIMSWEDSILLRHFSAVLQVINTASGSDNWKTEFFRALIQQIQKEAVPLSSRVRLVNHALRLNDPGFDQLFRQMISSPHAGIRALGLIDCATARNQKALPEITTCLQDSNEQIRLLSVFALSSFATESTTQILVEALLQGSEDVRMAAAQAFAMSGGEGFEILQEAATYEDILTRRAAVSGLGLIHETWSQQLLEKISIEDGQWVVRNAAAQMLETMGKTEQLNLLPFTPIWDQPWLIQYASEKGMGIAPGEYPLNLLINALKDGSIVQQFYALYALRRKQPRSVAGNVFTLALSMDSPVKDTAAWALWCMAACGTEIPSPLEYGLS